MVKLRGELAMARSEVNRLSQARDQTLADLSPLRPNAKGASLRPNNANDDVSRTGSIGEKTNKAQKDKAVSAKLSEKLPRNQQIAAVGIAAPSGQKNQLRNPSVAKYRPSSVNWMQQLYAS